MSGDTIFALASGRPPAAIAIVRISGERAHRAASLLAGSLPEPRQAAVRDLRAPETGELLDRALVLRFDAPASSTGEDVVELHCHGGRGVVDAVLGALAHAPGLRAAAPGEFTRRAFENGRIDLTEAEGLADLLAAETETQRRAALAIAEGGLRRQVEVWQARLIALSARAEVAIDYVDEYDDTDESGLYRECETLAIELESWLGRPRIDPLRDGVRVVLAGPPNAGKSSLINAIAGQEKAIVTEVPGTTRDSIEVPLALAGIPILLTDTAGIRKSHDVVERIGIARAQAVSEAADVLVWMGEPGDAPDHPRLIKVHSQCDRGERQAVPERSLGVSSVTGAGVDELLEAIRRLAASLVPGEDPIALNRRQADEIGLAQGALRAASVCRDPVLIADHLRVARQAFDRLTGRAGVEDVLDALFGRFCLGK